ncbi:hypothetical protein CTEN210_01072 [Chaetoceros tenuissimus]|uniref:BZIP domain-containing protein n=1 Tax=Chaetoceros tenuissimus TaxID=426638 RepID=A0AAD3GZJ1_9STRA|nr:hypothetical protein CTEN210_01072 [Chaetoceros tenuissimus]
MDHAKPLPSDMALKLLNSKDSKVAAAARRVFSNAVIIEEPLKTSDLSEVPKEIREAASAVINLMPRVNVNTGVKKISKNTSFSQAIQELDHRRKQEETEETKEKVSIVPKEKESQVTYSELNTSSQEKKRIVDPKERLHRSRERNKMHARKTRQRKKEQMKTLEAKVDELKSRQVELKRLIDEKNTANILVELHSNSDDTNSTDPNVEALLKRSHEEIPDASRVPELPALILPGQHTNRRGKTNVVTEYPDDGIDYELLAKDRATCSQDELDKIRRERNRMHAKRTRDRKRIFVEEMEKIIAQLEAENLVLETHLESITDGVSSLGSHDSGSDTPSLGSSPVFGSSNSGVIPSIELLGKACEPDIERLFSKNKRSSDEISTASTSSLSGLSTNDEEASPEKRAKIASASN